MLAHPNITKNVGWLTPTLLARPNIAKNVGCITPTMLAHANKLILFAPQPPTKSVYNFPKGAAHITFKPLG
eukprot:scaffold3419_cov142-Amphora_coffeaeformis.AAC.4